MPRFLRRRGRVVPPHPPSPSPNRPPPSGVEPASVPAIPPSAIVPVAVLPRSARCPPERVAGGGRPRAGNPIVATRRRCAPPPPPQTAPHHPASNLPVSPPYPPPPLCPWRCSPGRPVVRPSVSRVAAAPALGTPLLPPAAVAVAPCGCPRRRRWRESGGGDRRSDNRSDAAASPPVSIGVSALSPNGAVERGAAGPGSAPRPLCWRPVRGRARPQVG